MRDRGSTADKILIRLLATWPARLRVEVLSVGTIGARAVAREKKPQGSAFERDVAWAAWRGNSGSRGWELVGAFVMERESQTDALTVPHSAGYAAEPGSLPGMVCIDDSR
jgi:hypothetical protein